MTGEPPFHAESAGDLLKSICEDGLLLPSRHNAATPRELQNICLKALEKDAAARYACAREMADDLLRFLAGEAVTPSPRCMPG